MTKVKDVMVQNVKTAHTEDTVLKAAEIMNRHEIGCIIITENEKPVGILTERDILKRVVFKKKDPEKTELNEVMSKRGFTILIDIGLGDCEAKFLTTDISYDYVKINAEYTT